MTNKPFRMPLHCSGKKPPLPKSASSLIYRLRSKGWRIDTKARTVYIPATCDGIANDVPDLSPLQRLRKDFGFQMQTCMESDATRARVYISGPIAHHDIGERRDAFAEARRMLRRNGYLPINPMENGLPQPGDWHQHMRADIRNLLRCQYIYFLPGWQNSKGCRLEFDVAMSCGLQVLHF